VHSDEWASYRRVEQLPNVATHRTVNHSVGFVDSVMGPKLKRMRGCSADEIPEYLDEFMWCERWGRTAIFSYHGYSNTAV
jgi:hypothetical protein